MPSPEGKLPSFRKPPVIEVAVAAQFDPLPGLTTAHLGLFWGLMRSEFPRVQERQPRPPAFELFEVAPRRATEGIQVTIREEAEVSRLWLLGQDGGELVQIQKDRFVFNWRRVGDSAYPRYDYVRARFEELFSRFETFVAGEKLGTLSPNQAEVTYVNHIYAGRHWETFDQVRRVLPGIELGEAGPFLPSPEEIRCNLRYVIPGLTENDPPLGRLHVTVEPARRAADNVPLLVLRLSARGRPTDRSSPGLLGFLDLGRTWIVKGFCDLTSREMHEIWERTR